MHSPSQNRCVSRGVRANMSVRNMEQHANGPWARAQPGNASGNQVHAQQSIHRFTGGGLSRGGGGGGAPSAFPSTDPVGCVRPPPYQWFKSQADCVASAPAGGARCNARYINGVWTYYAPFARDPAPCAGGVPADILPQRLDSNSIVQHDSWYILDDVVLRLMMDGHIGQLSFSVTVDDVLHTYDIVFDQTDYIMDDLFTPLIYRYSVLMPDLAPELNQRAMLEINLTNGYVTVMMPMGNGSSLLQFVMTNIVPVMHAA